MKADREHRVPLSAARVGALLKRMQEIRTNDSYFRAGGGG